MKRLEELIVGKRSGHNSYAGGTEGDCLYDGDDASVQIAFLPAGTVFASHSHTVTEVVLVLCGRFLSDVGGMTIETPPTRTISFPPGQEHSHNALTDCRVVGVLVPRNGGYPAFKNVKEGTNG